MWEHRARGQAADEWERPQGAVLCACGRYRYLLWRRFGPGPRLLVVGFNPSTADAVRAGPTVARCAAFARRERAGVLELANLYALRATDPADVRRSDDPLGPDADAQLLDAIARADRIVAAWGSLAARPADRPRIDLVRRAARALRRPLLCLGTTRVGAPRHPLYQRADRPLERWRG